MIIRPLLLMFGLASAVLTAGHLLDEKQRSVAKPKSELGIILSRVNEETEKYLDKYTPPERILHGEHKNLFIEVDFRTSVGQRFRLHDGRPIQEQFKPFEKAIEDLRYKGNVTDNMQFVVSFTVSTNSEGKEVLTDVHIDIIFDMEKKIRETISQFIFPPFDAPGKTTTLTFTKGGKLLKEDTSKETKKTD